ncbi:hypothetical protein Gotri_021359, partial [Gossypium trilobum]|nr:hypothetical protein [Gossypium trilobum]
MVLRFQSVLTRATIHFHSIQVNDTSVCLRHYAQLEVSTPAKPPFCLYQGVLKFSSEEIRSNFLPYKDKMVALSIYKFLDEHYNYDDILRFHQLVYYENEWLLVLEHSENVVMHFSKIKSDEMRCKNICTEYTIKCLFITDSDGQ